MKILMLSKEKYEKKKKALQGPILSHHGQSLDHFDYNIDQCKYPE